MKKKKKKKQFIYDANLAISQIPLVINDRNFKLIINNVENNRKRKKKRYS